MGEDDVTSPLRSNAENDVLDSNVVAELRGLADSEGECFLSDVASLFLADAAARITELHRSVGAGDAPGTFAAAHRLAGSAANLGATELTALCATLADRSQVGNLAGARSSMLLIGREFARVEPAVRALIGSR